MVASTSSGIVNKLALIVKMEKTKLKKRGITNILLGWTLLFSFICISREIGIRIWPEHIENK
jgi:hypothetical protein